MQIKLLGWASSGLRCPDIEINLTGTKGGPAAVALIQMPNGTGKTTTLELLRVALTGDAAQLSPIEIMELRRPNTHNANGSFRVTLLADDRPVTFELLFDFESGNLSIRTSASAGGGVKNGWHPPFALRQFLTPAFLDLFIFDGEFADRMLTKDVGRADAAIGALCQLDLLDNVASTVAHQWKAATSKGGPKSAGALNKHSEEEDALIKQLVQLKDARSKALGKIEKGTIRVAELAKKIEERLGSVEATKVQHAEALLALEKANAAVSSSAGAAMAFIRMPLALHTRFADQLIELKDNLDKLKLPETSSAQFFADLMDDKECICGREMNDVAREEIQKRARGVLDSEEAGTINALKQDIRRFIAPTEEDSRNVQLNRTLSALKEAKRDQREAQQMIDLLEKQLVADGDPELETWTNERKVLAAEIERCRQALSDIDANADSDSDASNYSIKGAEKKLKEIKAKIAELSKTVELKSKTEILEKILQSAAVIARDTIRAELISATNERLAKVLANDPLRVDRIDQSLHLAHQKGASAGQKLSVGYTFLMSALSRGDNDFPLIVDSPAGPIDEGVRRKIGRLIPELCDQFVGFTINVERPGFVPALEAANDDCLFLTLFRRTDGTKRLEADLPQKGVTRTDNAVLINDRDYFMTFDVKDEDEL